MMRSTDLSCVGHVPLSTEIADLSRRVKACEDFVGTPAAEGSRRTPPDGGGKEPICGRVDSLERKVDDIFAGDADLSAFEEGLGALEAWLESEHAQTSRVVLHGAAKRSYVVQQSEQLQEAARVLRQVEGLEKHMKITALQELPQHEDKLRRIEVRSAVTSGSALKLHEHVAHLAEDYHKTIVSLNDQLLQWNGLFNQKDVR